MRVAHTVEGAALPVTGGLSVAVYRIVQEALTNVRKHAGPGAAAEVRLRYGPDELLVRVADDGRGTLPGAPRAGHGLAGMRERAAMYGGNGADRTSPGRRLRGDGAAAAPRGGPSAGRPARERPGRPGTPHDDPVPLVDDQGSWSAPGSPWFSAAASRTSRWQARLRGRPGRGAALAREACPADVMVMDVRMPEPGRGRRRTREIWSGSRTGHGVLIRTTFDLDEYAFAALRAGASGFLLKSAPPEELLYAVRCLHNGDAVVAPSTTRRLIGRFMPHLPAPDGQMPPEGPAGPGRAHRQGTREVLAEVGSGPLQARRSPNCCTSPRQR